MGWKQWWKAALIVCAGAMLLWQQHATLAGVQEGLALCGSVVIPSLFPFMVLAALLTNGGYLAVISRPFTPLTRLLRLPTQTGPILLLSLVGGYPVAAGAIRQMVQNGQLDRDVASRMLCFSVNAGPAFLVGAVGTGMFGDAQVGWLLYAACVCSSLLLAILTRPRKKLSSIYRTPAVNVPFSTALVQSVGEATSGILSICAYVLLFSAIKAILVGTGALDTLAAGASTLTLSNLLSPSFFSAIFSGLLEVTGGCAAALACGGFTALMLTACFCGFGGLSVHCQILAAVSGNGIRTTPFLLSRFFHTVCSCGILYLLLWFFPVSLPVFAISASPLPVAFSVSAPASIAMLLLGVFCLISPKYQQDGSNSGLPFSSGR